MKKWFGNISYTFAGKIIAMFFLVFLDIVAARFLPVELYAEWVFYFAVLTMLFWLGWFGINTSAKVYVSKCTDKHERIRCIKSAFVLRICVSALIAIIIWVIFPFVTPYLGYPVKYPDLKGLFIITPVAVFFNTLTEFYKEIFIGTESFSKLFLVTVIEYSGYFIFSLLGMIINRSVFSILYGYILSGAVVTVFGLSDISLSYKDVIHKARIDYTYYVKPIIRYAIPMLFISLGGLILVEMDTFMLGLYGNVGDVAVYGIAKNLCAKATHINYSLTIGVMTAFSIITRENYIQKKSDFNKAAEINYIVTFATVFSFALIGKTAIRILYGSDYIFAGDIIRRLTIYYALYGVSNFYSVFLDFRKKAKSRSLWYISVIVINFLLNCLWIPNYGAMGAAWATNLSLIPYTCYVIAATHKEWRCLNLEMG